MRQIATVGDEAAARKFSDYLLTLKIATQLLPEPEGTGVWVCDEDKVDRAQEEYQRFRQEPADPRYDQAIATARDLRRKEERQEKDYRRRSTRLRDRMDDNAPRAADRPLTIALIVIAVLVTIGSNFGDPKSAITKAFAITPTRMVDVLEPNRVGEALPLPTGEVWRAFTPIFLHFNTLHLVFNAIVFLWLGGRIEATRGTLRFLALVLVFGVVTTLCEARFDWNPFGDPAMWWRFFRRVGGLSGVIYGLLGYAWMKMLLAPELGLRVSRETTLVLLGWFVVCLTGVIGHAANVAHASGLVLGLVIGATPRLWKR